MRRRDANSNDTIVMEAVARANILGMTPRKWRLVRLFEAVARCFLPLIPSPQGTQDSKARPNTILVIEYWNLGDLAILVPFLRNLRRTFPRARISLLVNATLPRFLEDQGIVDEFLPVRVPWAQHFHRWKKYNPFSHDWISFARTLLSLRRRGFDWAFSGRMDVRDNFILWLSGARRRIGYGVGGGAFFLTDRVRPNLSRPHRADIWLNLLEALGEPSDQVLDGLRLTGAELAFAQSFLTERGIPSGAVLVGIHPGAPVATRRWGCERFTEVAKRLVNGTEVHVLWFSEPGNPYQLPPLERCHPVSFSLRLFLAVLSRCSLFICNDSGPLHLANLLGIPVVAIFGPQRPESFGPRGAQDLVVIRSEFSCRPCFDYCIFDQPYCLRTISTDEVYSAVENQMRHIRESKQTPMPTVNKAEWVSHVR
jgi:lipopolysaccharide heptosyltransferase II